MRAQFDTEPTLGMASIEDMFVDPQTTRPKSSWHCSPSGWPQIYGIGLSCTCKRRSERTQIKTPGLTYWRIFVLAVLKFGLDYDFDRLTFTVNDSALIRTLLQNDTSDFGHESLYRVQTMINNVSLITDDIWSTLNRMIVDHGLEVFGVASDAPLEARTDSYVVDAP